MIGTKYRPQLSIAAAVLAATFSVGQAQAASLVVDVSGIDSSAGLDDPSNTYLSFDIGADSEVVSVSWDITITAYSPSWLSEITLEFYSTGFGSDIYFTPSFDDLPGTASFSGSVVLADVGLSFFTAADGLLNLQFFEGFDDGTVAPDGIWDSGTITFDYVPVAVPEPETYALMMLGLAGLGLAKRRKAN